MNRVSRRQIVRGGGAAAAAMTLGAPSVHAQNARPTLRFVAEADLKIFDPVWTTAYITRNHGYLVYDTLFGTDENFEVKPQMIDRTVVSADGMTYRFTLRDGLRWHDGKPVLSEDCVESLKRWGKKDRFGQLLMAHTGKIVPVDKQTFTLQLAEPFGPVLDALGKPSSNVPFMMPARIAATPEGWLRPNCLHPPFNNKKARQALLHMMDQVTYLAWAVGQAQYYRACYSVFACGSSYATNIGAEPMMNHDLTTARQLVKESGYDGQPIVVLHVTDRAILNAAAIVTRQRLESIGFKVILKAMDWSTNLVARASKEPPDKGGWNLLHTWWHGSDLTNPAVHFGVSGAGPAAWFGWPDVPQLEKLVTDWMRATDQTKRNQLAEQVQKVAFSEVPYVPWGEWVQPTALRKNVRDVLKFRAPIFWNVKVA